MKRTWTKSGPKIHQHLNQKLRASQKISQIDINLEKSLRWSSFWEVYDALAGRICFSILGQVLGKLGPRWAKLCQSDEKLIPSGVGNICLDSKLFVISWFVWCIYCSSCSYLVSCVVWTMRMTKNTRHAKNKLPEFLVEANLIFWIWIFIIKVRTL